MHHRPRSPSLRTPSSRRANSIARARQLPDVGSRLARLGIAICCAVALSACAALSPNEDLAQVELSTPSLMVAKPVARTLYIVVDDDKLPDVVDIEHAPGDLHGLQLFATRDLSKALSPYFREVKAVPAKTFQSPDEPHVVADVRVDTIGVGEGQAVDCYMTWAFALRPSEAEEYAYSFAGTSRVYNRGGGNDVLRRLLETAISDMLSGFAEKGVHRDLRALPAADAAPAGAASEDDGTTAL